MNNFPKSILIISIALLSATGLGVSVAQANTGLQVEFEGGGNTLFTEQNFLPGDSVPRWVKVTNTSGVTKAIAAEAINYPGFPIPANVPADDLSRALEIIIREAISGADLYGGSFGAKTLFDFYNSGETYLSDVANNATKEYEFEISFPLDKGDLWQSKSTGFDILIGFCEDCGDNGNGDDNGDNGNGDDNGDNGDNGNGGTGGGGTVLPPGLTIQYENSRVATTTATITWLTSYKSTSRVIYRTETGHGFDLSDGEPNYGYEFYTIEYDTPAKTNGVTGHSITITGLTSGATYYFRCVSHASPDTIGTEHSFTTLAISTSSHSERISEESPPGDGDDESGIGGGSETGDGADADAEPSTPRHSEEVPPTGGTTEESPGTGDDDFEYGDHIYEHQDENDLFPGHSELREESLDADKGTIQVYFDDLDTSKFLANIAAFFNNLRGWWQVLIFLLWIIILLLIIRLIKSWIDRKKKTE